MWRCGRWRGGVRFWLLRFEVRTDREKRDPLAGACREALKRIPTRRPSVPVLISLCLLGVREVLGGFLGCGVDFYQAVDFGHFEEASDHFGDTGQVKGSAGGFQAGEAIYDSSQAGAVDFCGFREIEDDAGLFFAQKVIHGLSKAHAFDA
jgi:hypothetical protein